VFGNFKEDLHKRISPKYTKNGKEAKEGYGVFKGSVGARVALKGRKRNSQRQTTNSIGDRGGVGKQGGGTGKQGLCDKLGQKITGIKGHRESKTPCGALGKKGVLR